MQALIEYSVALQDPSQITTVWIVSVVTTVLHLLRHAYSFWMGRKRALLVEQLREQVTVKVTEEMARGDHLNKKFHALVQTVDLSDIVDKDLAGKVLDSIRMNATSVTDVVLPQENSEQLLRDSKSSILELLKVTRITKDGLRLGDNELALGLMKAAGYSAAELKSLGTGRFEGKDLKDI